MGADMIATCMILPTDAEGGIVDRTVIHTMFTEALAKCDEATLHEVHDHLGWDATDIWKLDGPWQDEVREAVQTAIDELFGGEFDWYSRDVACLWVGTIPLLVTGGMSWGDSPTESLEYISLLNVANLIPELSRSARSVDYLTLRLR